MVENGAGIIDDSIIVGVRDIIYRIIIIIFSRLLKAMAISNEWGDV